MTYCCFVFKAEDQNEANEKPLMGHGVDIQGIVLAGHSTGCQDVVRFVTKEGSDNIAGAVLQAAVRLLLPISFMSLPA